MSTISIDYDDILRFAPLSYSHATKKGYLCIKKGMEIFRNYYVLFGNMLYVFDNEATIPSSLSKVIYLESSTLKIIDMSGLATLVVTTVSGKSIYLSGVSESALQEWLEAIEANKFIKMCRKIEDIETTSIQLHYQVDQQQIVIRENDQTLEELQMKIRQIEEESRQLEIKISRLESTNRDITKQLKDNEADRLLLLKSRGITPKVLPVWALDDQPREGVKETVEKIKLWVGTWNLSSNEPFAGMNQQHAHRMTQYFVPKGYNIYVIGVQNCVSDSVFECLDGMLQAEGCRRLHLDIQTSQATKDSHLSAPMNVSAIKKENSKSSLSTNSLYTNSTQSNGSDTLKLIGRGEGSLLSIKFTGIAIYVHMDILGEVKYQQYAVLPFVNSQSEGVVAAVINALGRTLVFVNCHMESRDAVKKREQYEQIVVSLGSQLGEDGYHLNEQFHHIIWFGDLNYRLVDKSGNPMPVDTIVKMLTDSRLTRTLFESHDQLLQEKRNQLILYGYREPVPYPNFYPTYKKIENRQPVDYSSPLWVSQTYTLKYKESFFKGGKNKERVPGYCDRVFYHSIVDLAEDLLPEAIPVDMTIVGNEASQILESSQLSSNSNDTLGYSTPVKGQRQPNTPTASGGIRDSISSKSPRYTISHQQSGSLQVTVDNYQAVNENLVVSDHSPVFATFILRVRHDFQKLIEESKTVGSIESVLSVLSNQEQSETKRLSVPSSPMSDSFDRLTSNYNNVVEVKTLSRSTNGADKSLKNGLHPNPIVNVNKHSLLSPGEIYRVRISKIKLIWGGNEESPYRISLLFPSPYETIAGERFVDFISEGSNIGLGAGAAKAVQEEDGGIVDEPRSRGSTSFRESVRVSTRLTIAPSVKIASTLLWSKTGLSKTGTCSSLAVVNPISNGPSTTSSRNSTLTSNVPVKDSNDILPSNSVIPSLQLIWKGSEPLDRLHLAVRISSTASSIGSSAPRVTSTRSSLSEATSNSQPSVASEDLIDGHCSIGLEQLCKVAMASSFGASGCVSTTRMLINKGKPMYKLDPRSMQREQVSLCCTLELLSRE